MISNKPVVFISTHPFGAVDPKSLEILYESGLEVDVNPYSRKITKDEERALLSGVDALIAGTELLGEDVLAEAQQLQLIARVGIGVDNIDWDYIEKRNITVTYTPDAPTRSVAELTLSLIIGSARYVYQAHTNMRGKNWKRIYGTQILGKTIGIIGLGRIGKTMAKLLSSFDCKIIANDINPDVEFASRYNVELVEKDYLFSNSDIVSLHIPSTKLTRNLINKETLLLMKSDAFLINTSRGVIVNESDLYDVLRNNKIAGAAIDVYSEEPYKGVLTELENVILTCHMGSMTAESRFRMEYEAAMEVVRFYKNEPLANIVPQSERNP